ncbi:N-acetyltransferase [Roseiarcaceae bacterium H3SJ34-1]|uniref:GNAT family N-acetyltransferase n=1 Tax=Terripilifer ovatus TaxID=3032367 RepID=UPI003AB95E96|nr:N-acetyltransferase [Roseiarcaceae bacterium H3SJ34-1]
MTLSASAAQHRHSASIASLRSLPDRRRVVVREERSGDRAAREALLDAAMGAERVLKTSERLREGRAPARGLALVATVDGQIVGTVRLWHVCDAAGRPALLLGPLAVSQDHRELGIGGMLMREAIARASGRGHRAILLVGDAAYYERFGFSAAVTRALDMPGPVDRNRFLGLELQAGALDAASGCITVPLAAPAAARDVRRAA